MYPEIVNNSRIRILAVELVNSFATITTTIHYLFFHCFNQAPKTSSHPIVHHFDKMFLDYPFIATSMVPTKPLSRQALIARSLLRR